MTTKLKPFKQLHCFWLKIFGFLIIDHTFSVTLRSGEFPWIQNVDLLIFEPLITFPLSHGVASCWKMHIVTKLLPDHRKSWSLMKFVLVGPHKAGGQEKPPELTNCVRQIWIAISQDVAQKLISSKGQRCKYWLFCSSQNHRNIKKNLQN